MRRLLPLLGAVLALAFSGTAGADTFRVVRPHTSGAVGFSVAAPIAFTTTQQTGPMSFSALRGIWQEAGSAYGIPWEVLGAINKVETGFGSNLGPSSAGAVGWMQFMPSTWARWGIDANGDGVADPNNPTDAIFTAARYLAACGGQTDIAGAVYCYNHATWYVNDVLGLAAEYSRDGGNGLFSLDQLHAQLTSVSARIATMHKQLAAALEQARKLERAERPFHRRATTSSLLSNQLEAHKHAVLLAVRRHAAEARVAGLRERLSGATKQLGGLQDQANSASFAASSQLLSLPASAGSGVVSIALQFLGVPYVWAGATPSGFDCSGLVQYVFAQVGVSLPHNTVAQWNSPDAVSVPRNALEPGDLVFFNGLDHVGIYLGNGEIIDAPHTGANVRIDSLSGSWFAANYDGAKRIGGAPLDTFQVSSGSAAFTPDVVYFTQ